MEYYKLKIKKTLFIKPNSNTLDTKDGYILY